MFCVWWVMSKGEVLGLVLSKGEVLPFCPCTVALGSAVLCLVLEVYWEEYLVWEMRVYIFKKKKIRFKNFKKMLTWKIVESSKASVLYIYIDNIIYRLHNQGKYYMLIRWPSRTCIYTHIYNWKHVNGGMKMPHGSTKPCKIKSLINQTMQALYLY